MPIKGTYFIRDPDHARHNPDRPPRNAHHGQVRQMLGLSPDAKLPVTGMGEQTIQGIKVWVAPLPYRDPAIRRRKRSTHRVLAMCPGCLRIMSVGRLHQHVCTVVLELPGQRAQFPGSGDAV